jgi:hypothetical protein
LSGKSPHQAVDAFVNPLNRARSTVTNAVLAVSPGGYGAGGPHTVAFRVGSPRLSTDYGGLALTAIVGYSAVQTDDPDRGPWKVKTENYVYRLTAADGARAISFEWHPTGSSPVTTPHAQLGSAGLGQGLSDLGRLLSKAHIPTRRISLEQVLEFAIRELHVHHLRDDWEKVLEETYAAFEQWRTWG